MVPPEPEPPDVPATAGSSSTSPGPTPNPARRRRRQAVGLAAMAALIYLALGAALMPTALFGNDVVSPAAFWAQNGPFPPALRARVPDGVNLLSDNVSQFTPWLRFAADAFARDHRLPLWKSLTFCGAPFVGNGQSAVFFPTNLAAIVLGAPAWFGTAQSLFKLMAGALAAYLLARHVRLSFLAALLAGMLFGFGGFQAVFLQHPHTLVSLLLPLLLLCADRLVLAPTAGRVAALAIVAGLQHLGGHAETAVHCQFAAVLLGAARAWSLRREAGGAVLLRRLGLLATGLALGAVLGAVQILPQLEYIAHSDGLRLRNLRAADAGPPDVAALLGFVGALALAVLCALHLARGRRRLWLSALGLLLATGIGLLAGLPGGLSPTWIALVCADWFGSVDNMLGPVNYVELNGAFVGAALPLALLGLLAGATRASDRLRARQDGSDPARGAVLAAGIVAGVSVLALFRAPGVTDLLAVLPGLRLAENTRLSLLALLALGVLAGYGLDAIGRAALHRPALRTRFALLLLALLLGSWGALVFGVRDGRIVNDNTPDGSNDVVVHALSSGEVTALLPRQLLDRVSATLTLDNEPHKVFAGWFVSPPGTAPEGMNLPAPPAPAGAAAAAGSDVAAGADPADAEATAAAAAPATPPTAHIAGGRMLYTRAGRSVEALVVPALRDGNPATPWLAADGAPLCVFLAIVPAREFPPEVSVVRLRLSLDTGRALTTSPLRSLEDPDASRLPFPAQPAFPLAWAQLVPVLAVALLALALLDARGALRHGARAALVVLCGASLLPFTAGMLPLLPAWAFYPRSGALDKLASLGVDARMLTWNNADMPSEIPLAYGIRDVKGYDALHPEDTMALLRRATDHAPWLTSVEALPSVPDVNLPLLGAMSVRFIANWNAAPRDLPRVPYNGEAQLPPWSPFRIVRNPFFQSRARLVTGRIVEPDDERALDVLADRDFPHATTIVAAEGEAAAASAEPAGSAKLTLDRPDHVRVAVEPVRPCTLVLADTFYPGWEAFVDGKPRRIERVDVAFRGVAVQPGDTSVEFRYEPLPLRLGAAASAAGGLAVLVLLVVAARGPSRRTGRG